MRKYGISDVDVAFGIRFLVLVKVFDEFILNWLLNIKLTLYD